MPTYEYVCRSCDAHLEVVQRFDDASLSECPSCGGTLRKVFGNIGIAFKGSGFYKTDSRSMAKSGNGASKGDGVKGGDKDSGTASKDEAATTKEASPAAKGPASSTSSSGDASSSPPAKSA